MQRCRRGGGICCSSLPQHPHTNEIRSSAILTDGTSKDLAVHPACEVVSLVRQLNLSLLPEVILHMGFFIIRRRDSPNIIACSFDVLGPGGLNRKEQAGPRIPPGYQWQVKCSLNTSDTLLIMSENGTKHDVKHGRRILQT